MECVTQLPAPDGNCWRASLLPGNQMAREAWFPEEMVSPGSSLLGPSEPGEGENPEGRLLMAAGVCDPAGFCLQQPRLAQAKARWELHLDLPQPGWEGPKHLSYGLLPPKSVGKQEAGVKGGAGNQPRHFREGMWAS